MITYAEIKCFHCGNSFSVYWNKWEKSLPIECPYCVTALSERETEMLKYALGTVCDLNRELRSSHMEGRNDLFQVDFKHVYVPIEKYRLND